MPIYDFKCRHCAAEFSELCSFDWQGKVTCPKCNANELEKQLSVFSTRTVKAAPDCREFCPSGGGCSGCPGHK